MLERASEPSQKLYKYSTKPYNLVIAVGSLISGLCVLIISAIYLCINHPDEVPNAGASENPSLSVRKSARILLIIGISAVLLQILVSVAFWALRKKEPKSLIIGFIAFQSLIQGVLILCLVLILSSPKDEDEKLGSTSQTGGRPAWNGFWIVLSGNIVLHLAAISYLMHLVMKRKGDDELEEMVTVIHRRVPSRISTGRVKRHGTIQK